MTVKDFELDKYGNIDLSKYDADNPLNLEQTLSLPQQVAAYNDNVFGELNMNVDYKHFFGVEKALIDKTRENGTWWGSLDQHFRYWLNYCIDLGYLPWKIEFIVETDNYYIFALICEDKRIIDREKDTRCTGCKNQCTGLGMP